MSSPRDSAANKPLTTRLRLTMPSPNHSANLDSLSAVQQSWEQNPRRPSYSPVTPTLLGVTSDTHTQKGSQPEFIDEPDPVPVSLEENTDAIALKAALSILQLQKQQSQKDIRQLNKMKAAANREPEAFINALKAGKLNKTTSQAVIDIDGDETDSDEAKRRGKVVDLDNPDYEFGQFPNPQNVVRCPPINWAKYHVVGESLDKLHEEQRQRPEPGNPRRDEYGRPPEHVVAAPYRPFVDKLEPVPGNIRRESKE